MAAIAPSAPDRQMGEKMEGDSNNMVGSGTTETGQKQLDAGALFVLKSKGSWLHCGYHLTTSIVAPALLSLPFALAKMGWAGGVAFLLLAAVVTFYSYVLLSVTLEHHAQQGNRLLRFRDMAHYILGSFWGRYYVAPIQFVLCFAAVVAGVLLAGITLKAVYLLEKPDGTMKLYEFIVFGGILMLILAQVPSFHSLRHLNLISLLLCLLYSACATASSIYIGHSSGAPPREYSIPGSGKGKLFGVFTAISVIATTYGSGIIPEIQATLAPPVKGKMFKGLCLCYAVVISTFFSVAISGYWAFGNQAQSSVLSNFFASDGTVLIPKSFFMTINIFSLVQIFAVSVVYLQPTNEVLEQLLSDPERHQYSLRNVIPRIISRSIVVAVGTLVAAMIPFFGDLIALIGAFAILPLDFVIPAVMYNVTFRPPARKVIFWVNTTIAVVFSGLTVLGCIASVRQIVLDAKNYELFANV
ncbi:GABA transporter 1-like [Phalaenopsis equestris]|uniref:GABA transporter 1-like n=1 Tax=Phalaenopsis equestris TaxID=78828 RepID=UPI0009E6105D|nr:GABA transporter 1-like [Phalaenopsis equestris]